MLRKLEYLAQQDLNEHAYLTRLNPQFAQVFHWRPAGPYQIMEQKLPNGWREIDESTYYHRLLTTSAEATLFMQFYKDQNGADLPQGIDVHAYLFRDATGVAWQHLYWEERTRYFAFGCLHKYKELTVEECKARDIRHHGACWHVYECTECGHIKAEDSSG